MPVFTIISNIRIAIVAKKMFPNYKPYGKVGKEIKAQLKEKIIGLVINKICTVSRNAWVAAVIRQASEFSVHISVNSPNT